MNDFLKIETPRGCVLQKTTNGGKIIARLEWHPDFGQKWTEKFLAAQRYVDNEVLSLSSPYLPFQNGMLEKSGQLGTKIGSGQVVYNTPYARFLYYGKVMVGQASHSPWAKAGERKVVTGRELTYHGAPKRGRLWFERMKADHKREILGGARKLVEKG